MVYGKCHHFLYGKHFSLDTDQKPLETILNKCIVEAFPGLQHILTCCLPYDFTSKYIKGKTNMLADCMSHLTNSELPTTGRDLSRSSLNYITQLVKVTDLKIQNYWNFSEQIVLDYMQ